MVMKADVLGRALDAAATDSARASCCRPAGSPLTQAGSKRSPPERGVVLVCGRFEGVDERVIAAAAWKRSRSATTCCPAAKSPPWR